MSARQLITEGWISISYRYFTGIIRLTELRSLDLIKLAVFSSRGWRRGDVIEKLLRRRVRHVAGGFWSSRCVHRR
jgi:hypothetical protein